MDTSTIPHPPYRIPMLGDVLGIDPRIPVTSLVRRTKGLGPIAVQKVLNTELVIVSGADLVTELNDERRFTKHVGLTMYAMRELLGDALFTALNDEPNWQLAHDLLTPAFSREAMERHHPVMVKASRELLDHWDSVAEDGRRVDVTADMTWLSLEIIACAVFGFRFGSFDGERRHPALTALGRIGRYANLSAGPRSIVMRRLVAGSKRQHEADIATVEGTVDEIIDARLAGRAAQPPDLLDVMLSSTHPATGRRLDAVNIRQQIISLLVAGRESTAGALAFALYFLSRNSGCLARAQAEVDAVWGNVAEVQPRFADIARLRYIRSVVDEALRLWPTAPGYLREARGDTVLGGRYPMRRGDWVMVLLPLLHRDPKVWRDPERFDPERFLTRQARSRTAHAYRPFGTGARACIGRQFGLHEAVLVLALIVHRYQPAADDTYRLRVAESFTLKPDGFTLRLRRRRHRQIAASGIPDPAIGSREECRGTGTRWRDEGP